MAKFIVGYCFTFTVFINPIPIFVNIYDFISIEIADWMPHLYNVGKSLGGWSRFAGSKVIVGYLIRVTGKAYQLIRIGRKVKATSPGKILISDRNNFQQDFPSLIPHLRGICSSSRIQIRRTRNRIVIQQSVNISYIIIYITTDQIIKDSEVKPKIDLMYFFPL